MSTTDDKLTKILSGFEIECAGDGKMLTCPKCLRDTSYKYRGLCGPCFLFGDRASAADLRTPKMPSRKEVA